MKRVEANDPTAIYEEGLQCYYDGEYESALEYFTKAAELGNMEAHYQLSIMYHFGRGVEKDENRKNYHSEQAAIGGHPMARCSLACVAWKNGGAERAERAERAVKHFTIAANLGHDISIKVLRKFYAVGLVKKEDFAAALPAHKAAVDATKSPQRDAAAEYEAAKAARQNQAGGLL